MGETIAIVRLILRLESGEVLLLKRSQRSHHHPGCWEFPGGGMEQGEGLTTALRREVREETGLEIAGLPSSFLPVKSREFKPWPQSSLHPELYGTDSCVVSDEEEIVLSPAHEDFGFFARREALDLPLAPSAAVALEDPRLFPRTRR